MSYRLHSSLHLRLYVKDTYVKINYFTLNGDCFFIIFYRKTRMLAKLISALSGENDINFKSQMLSEYYEQNL
jgi:hypothetical protein